MNTATVDGKQVKVGDYVRFKSDVEQGGTIVKIGREQRFIGSVTVLTLESKNGFHGDYIGGQTMTVVDASDCWTE